MNEKQFIEKYCHNCGTQRCEGIGTEWFERCSKRWNLDGYGDPAAEIKKLNDKIMELGNKILELRKHGEWRILDSTEYGVKAECTNCGYSTIFRRVDVGRFCPDCGAEMDGKDIESKYLKDNLTSAMGGPSNLSRCRKCVYETMCSHSKDYMGTCPDYVRDAPDGGFYG